MQVDNIVVGSGEAEKDTFFVNPSPVNGPNFEIVRYAVQNPDGSYNDVVKLGLNPDMINQPDKPAMWIAMEPRFILGESKMQEFHISIARPEDKGEKRLASYTFHDRGPYAKCAGIWDLRATQVHAKTFDDKDYFMVATAEGGNGGTKVFIGSPNGSASFYFETNGVNNTLFITGGGVIDFTNCTVRMKKKLLVYRDSAEAKANGMQLGDEYMTADGTQKIVI